MRFSFQKIKISFIFYIKMNTYLGISNSPLTFPMFNIILSDDSDFSDTEPIKLQKKKNYKKKIFKEKPFLKKNVNQKSLPQTKSLKNSKTILNEEEKKEDLILNQTKKQSDKRNQLLKNRNHVKRDRVNLKTDKFRSFRMSHHPTQYKNQIINQDYESITKLSLINTQQQQQQQQQRNQSKSLLPNGLLSPPSHKFKFKKY
jgi:hypothetical protein